MPSKEVSILIFALSLTSIKCNDFCSLIKPNGSYEGLGMYRHYQLRGKTDKDRGLGTFVMYNRAGDEWNFQIDFSEDPISLKMIENSTKKSDNKDIAHRFGFFIEHRVGTSATIRMGGSVFDCIIKRVVGDSGFTSECIFDEDKSKTYLDKAAIFYPNSVIFKSYPHADYQALNGAQFSVYDKTNRKDLFIYEPLEAGRNRLQNCSIGVCIANLSFVYQMDESLFAKIDDIVHLDKKDGDGKKTGHLLLFNIESRPKYCYIPQTSPRDNLYSAAECKSKEDLLSLFDECFPTETVTPTVTASDGRSADPEVNPVDNGSPIKGIETTPRSSVSLQTLSMFASVIPILTIFKIININI